ncbi:sulfate/molybdate ABC transporter ATP-binding protein [Muricomes intestini]|uniref:sulfate/molybdate ABC transporter ATP-binding protein n=1 Tax=Muricomes intestini TaxID=1796634 RepID=UPI002FE0482F
MLLIYTKGIIGGSQVKKLQVDFRKRLKNFDLQMNFAMEEGRLGILGASGCGKSMTLKTIAGIVTPDTGRIETGKTVFYDSAEKVNLTPQKRKVGYLFQNYALFPNMTVADNIAAGIRHAKRKDKRHRTEKQNVREQVKNLIEQFQLQGLENQYPVKLSGGQQQRTALARILVSRPDILLLDEPFSAMDSYLREELQIELDNRLKTFSGCSVIVSHDRDEIYKLCSHTMIMGEGSNIIFEETKKLFNQPRYMQAARLTGCKNISKAKRVGPRTIRATDWGVEFCIDREIPKQLSYIGIRAHDFIPADVNDQRRENVIPVFPCGITKAPFEWTLLFQNKENPKGNMWMKQERGKEQIPEKVWVDQSKILLLE